MAYEKYIDMDRLIYEIKRQIEEIHAECQKLRKSQLILYGKISCLKLALDCVHFLQQEQTPTEREIVEAHRYAEMIRERDKARIQQEQQEADLEKEIIRYQREDMDQDTTVRDVAKHFYKLGLNVRKEE